MEQLDAVETRVLGSLLEKQLATPQYYPLTLNALVSACNQTSNREPVTSYTDGDVVAAIDGLRDKGLVRLVHSPGNRAPKYRHVIDEVWGLDDAHRAVLAVLLLRGPQTPGELRSRTERLAALAGLREVEELVELLGRRDVPLVRRLERRPGQKEARYGHLLSGEPPAPSAEPAPEPRASVGERLDALEQRVLALERRLAATADRPPDRSAGMPDLSD
jgi:uncharacterized protein YceH (UPF0502 family)